MAVGNLTISPDRLLIATGRLPNDEKLGLDALGIKRNPFIEVDQKMRTNRPNIYAIGDVNGLSMFDSPGARPSRNRDQSDRRQGKQF